MSNQIVLLEGRKEVTTFLLDDGDITSKEVITETGTDIGYEYTEKLYPEDTVTISSKSEIGKEMVKKYTGDNNEIPIGIIVNDPMVMDNGQRKASVLVLGQLYRLKLASNVNDIAPADKIKLTEDGAIKDSSGEFLALHPVTESDELGTAPDFHVVSASQYPDWVATKLAASAVVVERTTAARAQSEDFMIVFMAVFMSVFMLIFPV